MRRECPAAILWSLWEWRPNVSVALELEPMAKGKRPVGRPKGERDEISVKLDRALASRIKVLAKGRGESVGEFLFRFLEAPVNKEYAAFMRQMENTGGKS